MTEPDQVRKRIALFGRALHHPVRQHILRELLSIQRMALAAADDIPTQTGRIEIPPPPPGSPSLYSGLRVRRQLGYLIRHGLVEVVRVSLGDGSERRVLTLAPGVPAALDGVEDWLRHEPSNEKEQL